MPDTKPVTFREGERVQILAPKYAEDGTCDDLYHPGPTGTMFGYFGPYIIIELDEEWQYYAELKDGTKVFHSMATVHVDNLAVI